MTHRVLVPSITALTASLVVPAHAHDATQRSPVESALELGVGVCLAAALVLYASGVARMWRRAGVGRGISLPAASGHLAGWIVLAASLFGPLDAIAQQSFAAHMVQHELLMVVAAPLLVLGRPLGAWSWAFAARARRRIGYTLSLHDALPNRKSVV